MFPDGNDQDLTKVMPQVCLLIVVNATSLACLSFGRLFHFFWSNHSSSTRLDEHSHVQFSPEMICWLQPQALALFFLHYFLMYQSWCSMQRWFPPFGFFSIPFHLLQAYSLPPASELQALQFDPCLGLLSAYSFVCSCGFLWPSKHLKISPSLDWLHEIVPGSKWLSE